tara:strand:- start:612 stop:1598 length:987 start_codon:yes stop_codon:yes gene_type:complete
VYQGEGDAIDFLAYFQGYTEFKNLKRDDFWFYYLFYSVQRIGIYLSLNFYQWWALMTALSLIFTIGTIKRRNYNPHLFLFFFMIYYVFILYGGLKFFYGLCIFQYAVPFLLRGEKNGKLKFILITFLAGGFHVMYYMFLIFAFIDLRIKNRKSLIKKIVVFSLIFSLLNILSGRVLLNSMQSYIDSMENDKLSVYFALRTNWGFLLPIGIHALTTFYAFKYRETVKKYDQNKWLFYADTLLYINIIIVVFYPLFMIALTFMRLLTSFSIITIIVSGYRQEYFNKVERLKMIMSGLLIVGLYYFINIYLAGYAEKTVLPFFDSYFFNWL